MSHRLDPKKTTYFLDIFSLYSNPHKHIGSEALGAEDHHIEVVVLIFKYQRVNALILTIKMFIRAKGPDNQWLALL
jgi:hypothetical protein